MAKNENEKQPQSPKQPPFEEPEEIIEIVDEDDGEIIEIVDEVESQPVPSTSAREPASDVDLGAPVMKLDDGSDVIEVEDAEMEFAEPPSSAKKSGATPASGKQLTSPLGPQKKPTEPAGEEPSAAVPPKPLMPRVKKPAEPAAPTTGSGKLQPEGKRSKPTMVASRQASPTMLAPQEGSAEGPTVDSESQTSEGKQEGDDAGKRAAPTKIAARQAAPTKIASRQASPTMLAPQGEGTGEQPAAQETSPQQPEEEKKKPAAPTKIGSRQAHPTMMAPPEEAAELTEETGGTSGEEKPGEVAAKMPEMELGETKPEEVHEVTDIDELIDILDEDALAEIPEGSSVRKVGSASDELNVFDLVDEALLGPGSSVVDLDRPLSDKSSGVDIIAEELESQVGMAKSARSGASPEEIMEEEALGHEVGAVDSGSSAVDLGAAGGIPPSPLDIEDIYATEADVAALDSSKEAREAADLDETKPFNMGEEAFVVDENLLLEEGSKADDVSIENLIDLEKIGDEESQKQKGRTKEPDFLAAAEEEAEEAEEPATVGVVEEEGEELAVATKTKTKAKTKATKKKVTRDEEDDEDDRPARPKKPRYLRRWVGGTVVGLLLAAGAGVAVWYLQPDLLGQVVDTSPNKKPAPKPVPVAQVSDVQLATEHLNKGELDQAWDLVKDAGAGEDEKLAVRGQVQWLKYFQKHGDEKIPMKKDDPEVKQALDDLEAAKQTTKSDLLKQQILLALASQDLQKKVGEAQGSDKALKELLVQEKLIPPMPDPKLDLAKVVANLIADKKKQDTALAAVVKDKGELDKKVMQLQMAEQAVKDLLVKENIVKMGDPSLNEVSKVVAKVIMEKKDATTTLTMVNAKLKDAKIAEPDAKGVEKLAALREKVEKDYVALNKAAEAALKEINEGKVIKPGADISKQLVEGAKLISEKAKAPLVNSISQMVGTFRDLSGGAALYMQGLVDKTNTVVQLKFFEGREPLIESPEKKVENWIALFQNRTADSPKSLEKAIKDANWVSSAEAKAAPDAKARAVYLQGLLARHRQQFAEAKTHFAEALKLASALKPEPEWVGAVNQAMKELTDAREYYLPTVQKLQQTGQYPGALAQLNTGLKALPGDPNLLLQRAMLNLEQIPSVQSPSVDQQKSIREDAEAAKKNPATAPKAHYVLGQLEERLGALDKAKSHYEQALAALPKDNNDEANLYRLAIGRLLLTDPNLTPAAQPAIPAPKTTEVGMNWESSGNAVSPLVTVLLLSLTLGDLAEGAGGPNLGDVKQDVRLKKLVELAEEYKKSDNPKVQGQGYMLLGVAQSEMGKRTQGMLNYVKGMKLFYPGIEAAQLQKLIEAHPAFQVPDSLTQPSPLLAEQHFGDGLHLYFEREYEMAEEQFKKAISYFKNDARYHYFLGLAQYAQNTKDKKTAADHNITQGANLEIQDLPPLPQINLSLERIQGPVREYLALVKTRAKLGPQ